MIGQTNKQILIVKYVFIYHFAIGKVEKEKIVKILFKEKLESSKSRGRGAWREGEKFIEGGGYIEEGEILFTLPP